MVSFRFCPSLPALYRKGGDIDGEFAAKGITAPNAVIKKQ
jgi:hypothetical protein